MGRFYYSIVIKQKRDSTPIEKQIEEGMYMPTAIIEKEPQNVFSQHPEAMDKYFTKNNTTIRVVLDGLDRSVERIALDFQVTSASQYINYLREESEFWK